MGIGQLSICGNRVATFVACLVLVVAPVTSQSAVVLQFQVAELMDKAAAVFHGRAVTSHSEWTQDRQSIVTHVTFDVLDSLKAGANASGDTVTLTFTGGTVDGMSLTLSGLRIPGVGEEGVYFVESTTSGQDCPILGWNQGQFRVVTQAGVDRVFTADGKAVMDLDAGPVTKTFNEDRAAGVMVDDDARQALEISEFKNRMRNMGGAL